MITLTINKKQYEVDLEKDIPLLWIIREHLQLYGTKYGCGKGICGACTVHIDGKPERSCLITAGEVEGKEITTIEGIPKDHPIKKAWLEEQVAQCGYCQSGQIMQAVHLLNENSDPTEEEIIAAMNNNLCRCGTYQRIKKAIKAAAKINRGEGL